MVSVLDPALQRRLVRVFAGCALLLACLAAAGPVRAQTDTQATLAEYQERTAELLASGVAPVADPTGVRLFPAMDRAVHRGADGTWAATVAMGA